ncbi:MAG: rhodanese-like domain-containing protein [Pyrinomonadaceae bacterium]
MKLILLAAFLVFTNLAACQTAEYKKFKDDADVPRITIEDAKKAFDDGSAVIVDARAPEIYKQEHIKGAINIPIGSSDEKFDVIPKGKKIIVYCS